MKKIALTAVFLAALIIFCGCKAKEQNNMEIKSDKTITFINGVTEADVWIMPETEENLKTSLWGTPLIPKIKTGENRQAPLCEPGDDSHYIVRLIDTDGFYYSAKGITLEDGWALKIAGEKMNSVIIEVTDASGILKGTYSVSCARL